MMNNNFIPYTESLELKVLGFDEPCFGYYHVCDGYTKGYAFCYFNEPERYESDSAVLAPTFSQAFNFFEEKYQIFLEKEVVTTPNEILDIIYRIKSWRFAPITIEFEHPYDCFDKYKSELECLRNMINIIKNLK